VRRLLPPLLALLAALALQPACVRPRLRPNVLLICVDTLRADHLGPGPDGASWTPELDRFAAECVVLDHVQSPRAKTTPAVASLLTGLYPHDHGVRDLTTPLAPEVETWADALSAAGHATAGIVGNYVLRDELSGLARGFDLWVEDLPDESGVPPHDVPLRRADSLTDGVLCALGLGEPAADGAGPRRPLAAGRRPWFLYAHYMDPHGAYDPPEPHRSAALARAGAPEPLPPEDPASPHRRWVADYNVPEEARLPGGGVDVARVRALYGGEVSFTDAELGRLLRALRDGGLLETTLVVITADHGESLGEHDYWFEHGRHAYEATCRVPLLVRFPDALEGRPAPGRRRGDLALADLAPTLAELCDLPRPRAAGRALSEVRGRSRAGLLAADRPLDEPVFCEKVERAELARAVQTKAVRLGDWKLLRRYTFVEMPGADALEPERRLVVLDEELYDLTADPAEARDLSDAPPPGAPVARLSEELLRFSGADRQFAELARELQQLRERLGREDPEVLRTLRALGY
jgi:arylsulfatase A-like enzyme